MSEMKEYYNGEDTIQLPPPYSDYAVRPMSGQVINTKKGRLLCQTVNHYTGYKCVCLKKDDGRWGSISVHNLIGLAIMGKKLDDSHIAHIGDIRDNSVLNLKILPNPSGRTPKKRVGAFKDGKLELEFDSIYATGKNGFRTNLVSRCCNGRIEKYKGYVWKFL